MVARGREQTFVYPEGWPGYVLVGDGVARVLTEVALEREVLRDLVLELGTDGAPDEERVLHLLFRGHCNCSSSTFASRVSLSRLGSRMRVCQSVSRYCRLLYRGKPRQGVANGGRDANR